MKPAITLSGSPCKLCTAKKERCHLHLPSKKTSSPKSSKSSPKKSPKKPQAPKRAWSPGQNKKMFEDFGYLNSLPVPALEIILLEVSDRKTLHEICKNVKAAFRVCKEPRFQKLYNEKHGGLFVGKISYEKKEMGNLIKHIFTDEKGTRLEYTSKGVGSGEIRYISRTPSAKKDAMKGFLLNVKDKTLYYADFTKSGFSYDASDYWQNLHWLSFARWDPRLWNYNSMPTFQSVYEELKRYMSPFGVKI